MLPDSWRGHSVRANAQVENLRDKSGKMPELRLVGLRSKTSLNRYQVQLGNEEKGMKNLSADCAEDTDEEYENSLLMHPPIHPCYPRYPRLRIL